MRHARKKIIAVIGGTQCSSDISSLAEKTGHLVAEKGFVLVTGGGTGVMEAASKGAAENNGLVIGIIPEDDGNAANPFVHIPVATGMGIARNVVIIRTADVVIAIDGKFGTLSELAYAAQLNKPIIGLKTWDVPDLQMHEANTPEEAVALAEKLVGH